MYLDKLWEGRYVNQSLPFYVCASWKYMDPAMIMAIAQYRLPYLTQGMWQQHFIKRSGQMDIHGVSKYYISLSDRGHPSVRLSKVADPYLIIWKHDNSTHYKADLYICRVLFQKLFVLGPAGSIWGCVRQITLSGVIDRTNHGPQFPTFLVISVLLIIVALSVWW